MLFCMFISFCTLCINVFFSMTWVVKLDKNPPVVCNVRSVFIFSGIFILTPTDYTFIWHAVLHYYLTSFYIFEIVF